MSSDWKRGEVRSLGLRVEQIAVATVVLAAVGFLLAVLTLIDGAIRDVLILVPFIVLVGAMNRSRPRPLFDIQRLPRPLAVVACLVLLAPVGAGLLVAVVGGYWVALAVALAAFIVASRGDPDPLRRAFDRIDPRPIDVDDLADRAPPWMFAPLRSVLELVKKVVVLAYLLAAVLVFAVFSLLLFFFKLWQWTWFLACLPTWTTCFRWAPTGQRL